MHCSACGHANPDANLFCGQCGARLASSAANDSWRPLGERRQVTILFADLAGFTRLTRTLDAEDVHRILNLFFDVSDAAVRDHGGHIDKHIGDNVMALFGAPIAHTDDPTRAVRAALKIHGAVEGIITGDGEPLAAHIGIASGEVVASTTGSANHREYTVVGEAVNLASRLESAAHPGQTLVSDTVAREIRAFANLEDAGSVSAKGFDEDVSVWLVKGLGSPEASHLTPLVGRKLECAVFERSAETVMIDAKGSALCLRGEPGIGKTRLVDAFEEHARNAGINCQGALVLDFGGGGDSGAIAALSSGLVALLSAGKPDAPAALIDQGIIDADQEVHLTLLLGESPGEAHRTQLDAMSSGERLEAAQATIVRIITAVCRQQPTMIRIEDIHWADEPTLSIIEALAFQAGKLPLILVATTRIEGDPLARNVELAALFTEMTLDQLEPDAAADLAARYDDLDPEQVAACLARAGGHPLFLDQLLRNARESGSDSLPGNLQSAVAARMDSLPAVDRRALQVASVLGQLFDLDALRHLLENEHYSCTALLDNGLLRPSGNMLLFTHALVREGVLLSLLRTDRGALHRRAANWFTDRDLTAVAEHLEAAGDPEASEAFCRAGERATRGFRHDEALALAQRALALEATHTGSLCLAGDMQIQLGGITEALALYETARELSQDHATTYRANMGLASGLRLTDDYQGALEALRTAEQAADSKAENLAEISFQRGNLYFPLGDIDACLAAHQAALEHARVAGLSYLEARAHGGMGDAWYMRGRVGTAHEAFDRCIALAETREDAWLRAGNLCMRGVTRFYGNDLEGAWKDSEDCIIQARRIGHRRAEIVARLAGFVLYDMAQFDEAREVLTVGLEMARAIGASRFEGWSLMFLAKIAHQEGKADEATEHAEAAMVIARGPGAGFMGAMACGAAALCASSDIAVRAMLDEGTALLADGSVSHNHFHFHRDAMDTALARGLWDLALEHADALEAYTSQEPAAWSDFFIQRTRLIARVGKGEQTSGDTAQLEALHKTARDAGLVLAAGQLPATI